MSWHLLEAIAKGGGRSEALREAFRKALEFVERVRACSRELHGFLAGAGGGYVEPGPSGSITRGKVDVLPTGRNFYAIDPTALPTPAAWKVGVEAAEKLIAYYLERHGRYPESIGHWLWSLDGYKADGEQLAQILHLLGVRPIWRPDGSVAGVEPVPLGELGRPRIDCVVRLSGIARDTLPNYVYLIDEAVSKVASLDEPPELNYVRKHYLEHLSKLIELGRPRSEAEEMAKYRVFCSPPGSYGAGVNYAVEASAWRTEEDLAKVWAQWGQYAYTRSSFGKPCPEALILSLRHVDIITRDQVSDEHDPLNCCCYFACHGGFYNAVRALTGRGDVEIVVVDSREVTSIGVRGMAEELERVVRAKLLNPKWISEMKEHGYRGANEFSKKILHLYGWSAAARIVDDWVFEEIAKAYVLDEGMRKWFEENNVWALEEIARRLLEAADRGLWRASEETLEALREAYGELEGVLEESLSGDSDAQGGSVNVYTMEEVERWGARASEVVKAWRG